MILRAPFGHFLDRRLMLQEVAAVDRVVEVQPLAVALLPGDVVDAVDAALGANAVRAFDRREAHQVDVDAQFGQLHGGGQTGQPAADDHHALVGHRLFCSREKMCLPSPQSGLPAAGAQAFAIRLSACRIPGPARAVAGLRLSVISSASAMTGSALSHR